MRFFLGLVLSLGFLFFGLFILVAGFEVVSTRGMTDDAIASFVVGGLFMLIGIIIFFAARGASKRRKAGEKADYGKAGATIVGMSMVSDSLDDDFGDD